MLNVKEESLREEEVPPKPASFFISVPFITTPTDTGDDKVRKKQAEQPQHSWVFHRSVLKSFYSGDTDELRLLSVRGDMMDPVLSDGDIMLVNIADTSPSPPGIFVLHDGVGMMAKRIELIPEAAPGQIRISPANTQYSAYQRHLDDIRIIGRVVWYGRSLCH